MLVLKGECINGWNEKLSTAIGFGIVILLILATVTSDYGSFIKIYRYE